MGVETTHLTWEQTIQGITASLDGIRDALVRIAEEIDRRVPPPLTPS